MLLVQLDILILRARYCCRPPTHLQAVHQNDDYDRGKLFSSVKSVQQHLALANGPCLALCSTQRVRALMLLSKFINTFSLAGPWWVLPTLLCKAGRAPFLGLGILFTASSSSENRGKTMGSISTGALLPLRASASAGKKMNVRPKYYLQKSSCYDLRSPVPTL